MKNVRHYYRRIVRDSVSFWLMTVGYAIVIFALYNCGELITRIKTAESVNKRYPYEYYGSAFKSIENGAEDILPDSSQLEAVLNAFSDIPADKKEITFFYQVGYGLSKSEVTLDFSDHYADNLAKVYDNRKGLPGIYIGPNMEQYVKKFQGKRYLRVGNENFLVKGVYIRNSADEPDDRVVIPWSLMNPAIQQEFLRGISCELDSYGELDFNIGSYQDVTSREQAFADILAQNDMTFRKNDSEDSGVAHDFFAPFNTMAAYGMLIFAVINCSAVTMIWINRRRKEFIIRKILGADTMRIMVLLVGNIGKHILCSIPIAAAVEAVYLWVCHESPTISRYAFHKYLIIAAGIFVISMLSILGPAVKIRKISPAEGLKG